jgi:hypothetical protein
MVDNSSDTKDLVYWQCHCAVCSRELGEANCGRWERQWEEYGERRWCRVCIRRVRLAWDETAKDSRRLKEPSAWEKRRRVAYRKWLLYKS